MTGGTLWIELYMKGKKMDSKTLMARHLWKAHLLRKHSAEMYNALKEVAKMEYDTQSLVNDVLAKVEGAKEDE